MLAYILAIAIAALSLAIFGTAFFASDLHRKDDFLWSGVGLFYALVLWVCAESMRGAVLLGQTAATLLLISFGWQTLKLRKAIANPEKIAEIESFSLLEWLQSRIAKKKPSQPIPSETETVSVPPSVEPVESTSDTVETESIETPSVEETETVPSPEAEAIEPDAIEAPASEPVAEVAEEEIIETSPKKSEVVTSKAQKTSTAKPKFSLGKLFNFGKKKTDKTPSPQPATLSDTLNKGETETEVEQADEVWEEEPETVASVTQVTVVEVVETIIPAAEEAPTVSEVETEVEVVETIAPDIEEVSPSAEPSPETEPDMEAESPEATDEAEVAGTEAIVEPEEIEAPTPVAVEDSTSDTPESDSVVETIDVNPPIDEETVENVTPDVPTEGAPENQGEKPENPPE